MRQPALIAPRLQPISRSVASMTVMVLSA